MLFKRLVFMLLMLVMVVGAFGVQAQTDTGESVPVSELDPHFAADWMQLIYDRIYAEGHNPPVAARVYAYAGITLYESLLDGMDDSYNTLAGQIVHMPDLPLPPEGTYDWISVANHSLYTVMSAILPNNPEQEAETRTALTKHYDTIQAEREAEVGAEVVEFSIAYAEDLSAVLLDWIAEDGYTDVRALSPYQIPHEDESYWELTTEGTNPIEPYWGQMRPFILEYPSSCSQPLDMSFSTEPDSTFYQQALEVQRAGQNLTQEQREIAYFWVDTPGISGTPGGHWILIAGLMVDHLNLTLDRTAGMYALVGISVGDAFISCWEAKYRYNLLRPVTYIQRYIRNRWNPLIESPPFPEYPSGHSVVSGAAATVLTSLFGQVAFTDDTGLLRDLPPRSFTSFEAAATEAAISRMYGGIHYRVAIENGVAQGRCIGETIARNIRLQSFQQGE